MKKTFKTASKWLLALALIGGNTISETAEAKTAVVLTTRNAPPKRVDVRPIRPSLHHVWIDGYWTLSINGLTWVSGYWKTPVVHHVRTKVIKTRPVKVVKRAPTKVVKRKPVRSNHAKPVKVIRK